MDYRKAKSQPNLPQRIWSTSELPQIPRSHSVSTRQGGLVDIRSEVRDHGARPFSSLPNRPDSRMDSRPQSRLGSRPQSRISARPQQLLERPKSGVRPLSGRVFMRRTSERGWIAKAYPEDRTNSQTDVNLFDDLSDCESLDSFFDDEFDVEEQDEKLGNLLSCNTLGVESRGRRADWVAGDVGIPKFHCPRCRDHWYGISAYPCDEELARLIREGLWYTGKGDGNKQVRNQGQRRLHRPISGKKEFGSISNESLTAKMPNLRRHNLSKGERSSTNFSVGHRRDGDKKKKKRITFKLDNDDEEYSDVSTTGLDEDGSAMSSRNRGNSSQFRSDGDTLAESVGGMNGTGNGGSGRGGGSNGVDEAENGDGGLYNGFGNEDGTKGQRSSHLGGDSNGGGSKKESGLDNESGSSSSKHKRGGMGTDGTGSTANKLNSGNGSNRQSGFGSSSNGMGTGSDSKNAGHNETNTNSSFGANGEQLYNGGGDIHGDNTNNGGHKSSGNDQTKNSNIHSTGQVSQSGSGGGGGGDRGSRRGSLRGQTLGQEDHGKSVRKAVGYMRAVSPTSSEWGDPLHARSFISSTATSRSGSTTNLLRNKQRDEEEEKARSYLPPIVPSIEKKKPLLDLSDLMDGFQFTRAWTFSYHN